MINGEISFVVDALDIFPEIFESLFSIFPAGFIFSIKLTNCLLDSFLFFSLIAFKPRILSATSSMAFFNLFAGTPLLMASRNTFN